MSAVPKDFDYGKLSTKEGLHDIKFPQELSQNPVNKPRRCTDLACLFIFTATLVGMFVASFYGYAVGAPWKLIAPIDGDGNICGYTPGYEDYTKLYVGEITEAAHPSAVFSFFSYGVCVKACPETKDAVVECKPTYEVPTCQPTPDEAYTTYELLGYCVPNYDSLPQDVQSNWDAVT